MLLEIVRSGKYETNGDFGHHGPTPPTWILNYAGFGFVAEKSVPLEINWLNQGFVQTLEATQNA